MIAGTTGAGYAHPEYAQALTEFGRPRLLPESGGWVLERDIPGVDARDAMGCYPLFSCRNWSGLRRDCESLGDDLVSLTVVTDPFGNYSERSLHEIFPDLVNPFKVHFVADLRLSAEDFVSKHHQFYARKALSRVHVEQCSDPTSLLTEWCGLYDYLAKRHRLTGIKAFSERSFAKQLALPGTVAFRGTHEGKTVGAHLWIVDGDVAFSHLTAANESGYELMVAYALHWEALKYFAERVRFVGWGGGAGQATNERNGLVQFKRGWANEKRTSFLCGVVLNPEKYRRICAAGNVHEKYFPAYRAGELI